MDEENAMLMPNLKGLTMREAIRKVSRFKFKIRIEGQGLVYQQSISMNKKVLGFGELVIYCK